MPTSYTWPVTGASPTVANVRSVDLTTIDVTFSEDMVLAEALDMANYAFSGGLTALSIVNVSGSSRAYRVTTSAQTPAASYTVTVSNVHSLAGQAI